MSVIVKGMKMPRCCEECLAESVEENYYGDIMSTECPFIYKGYTEEVRKTGRLEECPLVEVPTWIPVSEKLPQKCQFYLVTDYGEVEEAYYDSDGVWFSPHGDKLKAVSHWMSLPEPAKEETDV